MRLVLAHARAQMTELRRYPAFLVPTLGLPAMFFLFFAVPSATDADANAFMASYAAFAVLGIAFFQFGVGIAGERTSSWELFLRTLPIPPHKRFGARLLSALAFGIAAAIVVIVVAILATTIRLSPGQWAELAAALLLGSIPFALLGIAIGYWAEPKAALPLANVLYLILSYGGGLWTAERHLPRAVGRISPYLPTRQWGNALQSVALGRGWEGRPWLWLGLYAAVFGLLAAWGYRRDEGQQFS